MYYCDSVALLIYTNMCSKALTVSYFVMFDSDGGGGNRKTCQGMMETGTTASTMTVSTAAGTTAGTAIARHDKRSRGTPKVG